MKKGNKEKHMQYNFMKENIQIILHFLWIWKFATGNKYLDTIKEPINHNIIPLFNKIIFLEALKKIMKTIKK